MADPPPAAAAPPPESAETRRERVFDLARTTAFSDGVFAIAITLLVLTIEAPKLSDPSDLPAALGELSDSFFSYAVSFAVIGLLWFRHHRFFGSLAEVDGQLVILNLAYLAFVSFIPFPTNLIGEYPEEPIAVALYAGTIAMVGLIALVMWRYANAAGLVSPGRQYLADRATVVVLAIVPVVMLISIPIAYLVSPTAAMYSWALIFLGRAVAIRSRRSGAQ